MDLTEAEDIKKRWQEYAEELYKKDVHDPDNHDCVITHLEPDILECEVMALGSITINKASGGYGIPLELFQILKDNAAKVLHSICQQIWKTQQHKGTVSRWGWRCEPISQNLKPREAKLVAHVHTVSWVDLNPEPRPLGTNPLPLSYFHHKSQQGMHLTHRDTRDTWTQSSTYLITCDALGSFLLYFVFLRVVS